MVVFWSFVVTVLIISTAVAIAARYLGPWLLQASFAAMVIVSTYTASKIGVVYEGVYISVAVALYSASFLMTDTLGEIWGPKIALRAVLAGFVGQLFMLVSNYFVLAVPAAPYWGDQEAFSVVLGATPRLILASILAYGAAQLNDIYIFDRLKKQFKGRWLFLRNNLSTFLSQTIDTVVFFGVGFWGLVPNIWSLIGITILVKIGIAALDTPFLYLVRGYYRKTDGLSPKQRP